MGAKAGAAATDKKVDGEIFFQNEAVSLCLLVQRRARTMRVIDFRAGPSPAKRTLVLSLARREGVEKVFTVVERDEVATWVKLGFSKEGSIPGFYKRSDAFLLGCPADAPSAPRPPMHSERRLISPGPRAWALASIRPVIEPDRSSSDDVEPSDTTAYDFAEKTLIRAKKLAKELAERAFPSVKMARAKDAVVRTQTAAALRSGRALTAFEPFGRDATRSYFSLTARGGFELLASVESQSCFGNAFIELLTPPRNDGERVGTASALASLCGQLHAEGAVGCFALAPSDDAGLAMAFVHNGFRRTGVLQNHLLAGRERKDAIVFARKLANPAGE